MKTRFASSWEPFFRGLNSAVISPLFCQFGSNIPGIIRFSLQWNNSVAGYHTSDFMMGMNMSEIVSSPTMMINMRQRIYSIGVFPVTADTSEKRPYEQPRDVLIGPA